MNNLVRLGLVATCATTLVAGDAKDALQAAAKKLADKPNYSWTSTLELEGTQFRPGPTKGKTEKDGCTVVVYEGDQGNVEAVLKGDKGVVKTEEGWQTGRELSEAASGGGGGPARWLGRLLLATKRPAQEVEDLLTKVKELKPGEDGVIAGDLTEEGAKELLTFRRRAREGQSQPPPPKNAKGAVKFWVKDGLLSKFQVRVSGTVTFGQNQEERDVTRVTTTEINEVGTTKIEVPEAAKKKLSS